MKTPIIANKTLTAALLASAALFSTAAAAFSFGPYQATAPGQTVSFTFAGFSAGETVIFTITGEGGEYTLAATPDQEGGVARVRAALTGDGVLPNGTYTFVDDNGGEAQVQVEDGEITVLH